MAFNILLNSGLRGECIEKRGTKSLKVKKILKR